MENSVAPLDQGFLTESIEDPVDGSLQLVDSAQVFDIETPPPHIPADIPEDASTDTATSEASSLKRSKPHDEPDEGWQLVGSRSS